MNRLLSTLAVAGLLAACSRTLPAPDTTIQAYVDAVDAQQWRRAYTHLAAEQRGAMTEDDFVAYCEAHAALMQEQAYQIRLALEDAPPDVAATVPLGPAREALFVLQDSRWHLESNVPLMEGGDTPEDTLASLASLMASDGVRQLLSVMSEDMRGLYSAEYDAMTRAFADASTSAIEVRGDFATVYVGDLTIRLVREAGSWRLDGIDQPTTSTYGYYEEIW